MPLSPERKSVAKDRFESLFPTPKPQTYHDPASRGPGSHTIRSVAWNPTGQFIATGSADRMLRVWDPEKPQVKNSTELRGHTGGIEMVAWNPTKEDQIASVSSDGTCRFWNVRSKTCTATIQLQGEGLTVCWSADGEWVLAGTKNDYLTPIVTNPHPVAQAPYPQNLQTNQATFNHTIPPSHLILTRGDGSISILSFPSMVPLHTLHAHTSSCVSLALSPTGKYLAIGGSDALISLYDTWDWVCKKTIISSVGSVKSVAFSFDGSYIVGGCDEGSGLEVVHVESGEGVGRVELGSGSSGGGGGQVAWHPGKYWIAYAGEGGALRILGAGGGAT